MRSLITIEWQTRGAETGPIVVYPMKMGYKILFQTII